MTSVTTRDWCQVLLCIGAVTCISIIFSFAISSMTREAVWLQGLRMSQDVSRCLNVFDFKHKDCNAHQFASIRPFQTYCFFFNSNYQKLARLLKGRKAREDSAGWLRYATIKRMEKVGRHMTLRSHVTLPSQTSKATLLSKDDPWQSCVKWNTKITKYSQIYAIIHAESTCS